MARMILLTAWVGLAASRSVAADTTGLLPEAEQKLAGQKLPRYRLQVRVQPPSDFRATLHYTGTARQVGDRVHFELLPNTPRFDPKRVVPMTILAVREGPIERQFTEKQGLLEIGMGRALTVGQDYALSIEFEGRLPRQATGKTDLWTQSLEQFSSLLAGERGSDYGLFSIGDGIWNLARFYPAAVLEAPSSGTEKLGDARTLELADYELELELPSALQPVSSGILVEARLLGQGRHQYRLQARAVREVALALSERFDLRQITVGPVLVRSFYDCDHAPQGQYVLRVAARALQVYTEAFGPYPYTELDLAESPLYGGAAGVEFPGFVTIANLFYQPTVRRTSGGLFARAMADLSPVLAETLEFVVAHEVAHQWWSATVASDALRYPYLDEALANFSALLYFEKVHGFRAAQRQAFLQMRFNYWVHRLSGGLDVPANQPTAAYEDTLQYAAIVYGKAGLFFPELRKQMGEEAFFKALQSYYRDHFLGLAEPDALRQAFLRQASDPEAVAALYQRWIAEAHGDKDLGEISLWKLTVGLVEPPPPPGKFGRHDPIALLMHLFEKAKN